MKDRDWDILYRGCKIKRCETGLYFWINPRRFDVVLKPSGDFETIGSGSGKTFIECQEQIDEFLNEKKNEDTGINI